MKQTRNTTQTIIRGASVVDPTPGTGNLVRLKKADKLSLVGLPANQTGFKIVRKDTSNPRKEEPMSKQVVRRTRRADTANPVLALTFPAGTTETEVTAALESYGMAGYTIKQEGDLYMAVRADLQSISRDDCIDIRLNEAGVLATVKRSEGMSPMSSGEKTGIAMVALEFDSTKFTQEEVSEWLTRNAVDTAKAQTENSENAYVVRRSAVPETEETRRLELEEGVTAVLIRADAYDIPEGFYAVVNELAYGSWGWGQLDFAATMADEVFSEQVRLAVNKLEEVLRNILYWSPLPLDVRKTLMTNSLTQFGAYVEAIMDSLPRQLLVSVVRSAQPQLENVMTKANEGGAPTPAGASTPANQPTALTREDVASIVTEAVKPLADRLEKVERSAKGGEGGEPAPEPAAADKPLTRADITGALSEVLKPVTERLDKLEGTTVVRNDGSDPTTTAATPTPAKTAAELDAAKKDGTIFRGAFGPIVGRRNKAA